MPLTYHDFIWHVMTDMVGYIYIKRQMRLEVTMYLLAVYYDTTFSGDRFKMQYDSFLLPFLRDGDPFP